MPALRGFRRPTPTEGLSEPLSAPQADARGTTGSSRASTERVAQTERIPLGEFRQAIREGIDLVFLVFGGVVGRYLDHRRHRPHDPNHWKQTPDERKAVVDPGSRFIRRHLKDEPKAQDTLDILLMATGVSRYTARTVLDIDHLEELPEEETPDEPAPAEPPIPAWTPGSR